MASTGAGGCSRYRLDRSVSSTYTMRQILGEQKRIANVKSCYSLEQIAIQLTNLLTSTHLQIQSRFWKISDAPKIKEGIYVDDFENFPMSRLMHKFFEKYNSKLSLISL